MDFIKSVFAFFLSLILMISPLFPSVPHKKDFVLTWSDEFDTNTEPLTDFVVDYIRVYQYAD